LKYNYDNLTPEQVDSAAYSRLLEEVRQSLGNLVGASAEAAINAAIAEVLAGEIGGTGGTGLDQDTLDALAGTSGTPSAANRFVTNSDARLGGATGLAGVNDAKTEGAVGDGVTDDRAALNTLANTTLAAGGTIYFPPGVYLVASDLTFASNLTLWFARGAVLKPANGVTITIRGHIHAGLQQIFDTSTTGAIRFSTSGDLGVNVRSVNCPEVYPEWWGALGNGTNDDTLALRRWIEALNGFPVNGLGTPRWADAMGRLSAGVYKVTGQVKWTCIVGPRIEGAGYENTVIRFHGGESNTATSGGASTLTRTGANWTTNQWANGIDEYHVYIHTGTGAGQWRKIASNTIDTLTTSTPWTTQPDGTSKYHIAIKSVLDLNGFFDGQLSHFTVEVNTGSIARARHGILYYRDPSTSTRGSSRGKFYALKVGGPTIQSAYQLGDIANVSIWQEDLCTLIACQAQGSTTRVDGLYQTGFSFGTGAFSNALNFTALGCESLSYGAGIAVQATNLIWTGGTFQGNDTDIVITAGAQGYCEFRGNRSEGSHRLYHAFTGNSVGMVVVLATHSFRGEDFNNGLNSNQPDLIYHEAGGTLIVDGLFVNALKSFTGTATSATSTTLTDTGKTFVTANGGMTGWDVKITGGTGVGQRRTITSNTTTQITVPAWTVTPDATSTYRIGARARIATGANKAASVTARNIQIENTPIENAVFCGSASVITFEHYTELNTGSEPQHYTIAGPISFHGASTAQAIAAYGFGKVGLAPDAALFRTGPGTTGSGRFEAGMIVARACGTTPPSGQVQSGGDHSGGATTHTYRMVGKVSDGAGGFKRAAVSTPVSVTNCKAQLTPASYVVISSPSGDRAPFTHFDILKTDTNTILFADVPWYRFPIRDEGQSTAAYSPPAGDETGILTAGQQLRVGNSAAGSSLGSVTKKIEIFDAAGASLGFIPVYDSIS
jgi:hypothetical protein